MGIEVLSVVAVGCAVVAVVAIRHGHHIHISWGRSGFKLESKPRKDE